MPLLMITGNRFVCGGNLKLEVLLRDNYKSPSAYNQCLFHIIHGVCFYHALPIMFILFVADVPEGPRQTLLNELLNIPPDGQHSLPLQFRFLLDTGQFQTRCCTPTWCGGYQANSLRSFIFHIFRYCQNKR